jgi:glycosyltransferase involved in cell wall biosynthesis
MSKKILLLGNSDSVHIQKWATALAGQGYVLGIFSFNKARFKWHEGYDNIHVIYEPPGLKDVFSFSDKLAYALLLPKLRKAIREFNPDILHAHYATSYGLLGALSGFRPFVLSTWGSDVFEFPNKSQIHKRILKYNLSQADAILSTSHAMKHEVAGYTNKPIEVTPFGVDMNVFYPREVKTETERRAVYIGMIKSIEEKYGVQNIIEAVHIIKSRNNDLNFKVLLVGDGKDSDFYKKEISDLHLEENFVLPGKISYDQVSYYHNLIDIFVNVSVVNESFGVSVIEAMACEKPVIVSNAAGLKEIVTDDTGIIIEKNDSQKLADALEKLIKNPDMAAHMGARARKHVAAKYNIEKCLDIMTQVYDLFAKPKEYCL